MSESLQKDYYFIESTISICSKCQKKVEAKIIMQNNSIFVLKNCLECGEQKELLEEEADFYLARRKYDKPATKCKTQTPIQKGCPFDCGICPDHEQHTCIGLIEITQNCDLNCPVCYASSCKSSFLSLKKIEEMMDFYIDSEFGKAEILQITGGEPTTHPQILEILQLAKSKNFKYVMLNTNGIYLAENEDFVEKLAEIFPSGFEIYLQFDGFSPENMKKIRGRDLTEIKQKAIANLTKYEIPITLVSTIERDLNDSEIGEIVKFGLREKMVRGINFQPVAYFGRIPRKNLENRITLTGVLNEIESQTDKMILKSDFISLPCYVDRIAITYLKRKKNDEWRSVMRDIEIETYLPSIKNTLSFTMEETFQNFKKHTFKCNGSGGCINSMFKMSSILDPKVLLKSAEERIKYVNENFFRISVTSFVDIYNFDIKSVKKDCVHIITPDLKKIPFSSYNMFYRK